MVLPVANMVPPVVVCCDLDLSINSCSIYEICKSVNTFAAIQTQIKIDISKIVYFNIKISSILYLSKK